MRVDKFLDLIVEVVLIQLASNSHALREICGLLHFDSSLDSLHGLANDSNVLGLFLLTEESYWVGEEPNSVLDSLNEMRIEDDTAPSDAVFDQIREQMDRANSDTLFGWVHRV